MGMSRRLRLGCPGTIRPRTPVTCAFTCRGQSIAAQLSHRQSNRKTCSSQMWMRADPYCSIRRFQTGSLLALNERITQTNTAFPTRIGDRSLVLEVLWESPDTMTSMLRHRLPHRLRMQPSLCQAKKLRLLVFLSQETTWSLSAISSKM